MSNTVLIAGCGAIGRRHLQALAGIGRPLRVFAVEPNAEARKATEELLAASGDHVEAVVRPDLSAAPEVVDLAVVATSSMVRRKALEALLETTAPGFLLLEKVLFPTHADLDACGEVLARRGIPTAVNCGRRGFPDYARLRERLAGRKGFSMNVEGTNWNLCSNGIHFIDLASYVLGETLTSLSGEGLGEEPVPTRHPGCVELHGAMEGRFAGGGSFRMASLPPPPSPSVVVEIRDGEELWRVEEGGRRLIRRDAAGLEETEDFELLMVSAMGFLYEEMMDERRSRLPSYEASAAQHRLFLDAIRRRLGLSLAEDAPCPIS